MVALEAAFKARTPLAIVTVLGGTQIGRRAYANLSNNSEELSNSVVFNPMVDVDVRELAELALDRRTSFETKVPLEGVPTRIWADYRAARPGLWIFSAGDDAKPLATLGRELGWFVAVGDGRSHLATRERFPSADEIHVLPIAELPDAAPAHLSLLPSDAAVVMTHSFEQDSRVLASLLALAFPLAYLGVLGPQRRTRELLAEAAGLLHLPVTAERVDQWLAEMHAPTGLDLGADTPAAIALSVVAEIQKVISAATGEPLRQIRAAKQPIAC